MPSFPRLQVILFTVLFLSGVGLRILWMDDSALWCDEAESSINALSIQQTGVPSWQYLGLPVYENVLTEPWPDHPEYEFRDSSYSDRGVTVYHGWLPLYAIAASQALFGVKPDKILSPPAVQHQPDRIFIRTIAPRVPSIIFSALCLIAIYRVGLTLGGAPAALTALTLMALNAQTVNFGIQARYYSATLLFTATSILCLLHVARRGHWRDYILLGISAALLFHTHLFSTIIFAAVALTAAPFIWRQPQWVRKAIVGGSIAAILTAPWVFLSGFLRTASSVPKAWQIFDSPVDAVAYLFDRPLPLTLVVLFVLLGAFIWWRPSIFPKWLTEGFRNNTVYYFLLIAWMIYAYIGFHLLMPAASYFIERLTLILWTPFVLLFALVVADLLRFLPSARAQIAAICAGLLLLVSRHNLAFFQSSFIPSLSFEQVGALVETLADRSYPTGTRFYAFPSDHLVITYYTGLPVQSVAPIRRKFLENFPHEIILLERQAEFRTPESIRRFINDTGLPVSDASTTEIENLVRTELTQRTLADRGIGGYPTPTLNDDYNRLIDAAIIEQTAFTQRRIADQQDVPILRAIRAGSFNDLWLGFFYRFVDPASRIGRNLNILPRLRDSQVIPIPEAEFLLFVSPPPLDLEDLPAKGL